MASPVARARFGRRGFDGGSSSTVPARKAASVKLGLQGECCARAPDGSWKNRTPPASAPLPLLF
uniref:Uncharacterized protein n=1 Tax=Oryza nivara TaxID=4536 RepID=A0A0E0FJP3_ORYNI